MKRVMVLLPGGGFAVLMPDVAEGIRIEQKNGVWHAELELPTAEGTELYHVGAIEPWAGPQSDKGAAQ